ncbi:hypothetical protein ES705_47453 [subsurface metagenome]
MGKKKRRSSADVIREKMLAIQYLEQERDRVQKIADTGNAAAVMLIIQLGMQIATIVASLKRRRR